MLDGSLTIVTGGSRGIGREISLRFAEAGSNLVINYNKSKTEAYQVADEIKQHGVSALPFKANVTNEEEVRQLILKTIKEFGRIDYLINNAGWSKFIPITDLDGLTDEVFDRTFSVNFKGALNCSRAAIPYLKKNTN